MTHPLSLLAAVGGGALLLALAPAGAGAAPAATPARAHSSPSCDALRAEARRLTRRIAAQRRAGAHAAVARLTLRRSRVLLRASRTCGPPAPRPPVRTLELSLLSAEAVERRPVRVRARGRGPAVVQVWTGGAGEPCPPAASRADGPGLLDVPEYERGPFDMGALHFTPALPGRHTVCAWLTHPDSGATLVRTQMAVDVRPAVGVLAPLALIPAATAGGEPAIAYAGETEVERDVSLWAGRGAGACAPTPLEALGGSPLPTSYDRVGAFADTAPLVVDEPGTYLVCAWLGDGRAATPVATQGIVVTLG